MSLSTQADIQGIVEYKDQLDRILSTNPAFANRVRTITRSVLKRATAEGSAAMATAMPGSIHAACKAVRYTVYKRILGGNINILDRRNGSISPRLIAPTPTLVPGQRGGNRITRSDRTASLLSYYGKDRGFILRFLNSGTDTRTSRFGNRGSLSATNIFPDHVNMDRAAEWLSDLIDEEIAKTLQQ